MVHRRYLFYVHRLKQSHDSDRLTGGGAQLTAVVAVSAIGTASLLVVLAGWLRTGG
jgi:hypothetical protein